MQPGAVGADPRPAQLEAVLGRRRDFERVFDGADAPAFVTRCTRDAMTPGICLSERRVDGAHVTFRFPRSTLSDWRNLVASMDKLIERMQSKTAN